MSKCKPYDYMEQMRDACTDSDMKRIMRHLVREAVRETREAYTVHTSVDEYVAMPSEIARKLVP